MEWDARCVNGTSYDPFSGGHVQPPPADVSYELDMSCEFRTKPTRGQWELAECWIGAKCLFTKEIVDPTIIDAEGRLARRPWGELE